AAPRRAAAPARRRRSPAPAGLPRGCRPRLRRRAWPRGDFRAGVQRGRSGRDHDAPVPRPAHARPRRAALRPGAPLGGLCRCLSGPRALRRAPHLRRRQAGAGHRLPPGHRFQLRPLQHARLAPGERRRAALRSFSPRSGAAGALRATGRGGGAAARGVALMAVRLADRIAVVTGAGRGIGRAIAVAFAEEGADLVLAARTQPELEAVADVVRAEGRRALVGPTDVTREEAVRRLAATTLAEMGRVDILVNNAGWGIFKPLVELTPAEWDAVIAVDLRSVFLGAHCFA